MHRQKLIPITEITQGGKGVYLPSSLPGGTQEAMPPRGVPDVHLGRVVPGFPTGRPDEGLVNPGRPVYGESPVTQIRTPHQEEKGPTIHIPTLVPKLRKFLAEGQSPECFVEAMCDIRHDVNSLLSLFANLERAVRLQSSGMIGPMQPELQTQVIPFDVKTVSPSTTSSATLIKLDAECFLQGFIGGQWNSNGNYVNNSSRWQIRRADEKFFFVQAETASSNLPGIGEEVFGENLDHWAEFASSQVVTLQDVVNLYVRNEDTVESLDHRAALLVASRYASQRYDFGFAPEPRWISLRTSDAVSSGVASTPVFQTYTFRYPSRVIAVRGRTQPANGITNPTVLRIQIVTHSGQLLMSDPVADQLLFGRYGQRTFSLTHPLYIPAGGTITCKWFNDIASGSPATNHNVAIAIQQAVV